MAFINNLEDATSYLEANAYDIICAGTELIDVLGIAHDRYPAIQSVYLTQDENQDYVQYLFKYPFLSNIVSIQEINRTNVLQNILSTISKILTRDLWGFENWKEIKGIN